MTGVRRDWPIQPGMTLVELLLALGVVAVAVPLTMGAMATSLAVRRDAETDSRAAAIARTIVADLKQAVAGGGMIFRSSPEAGFPGIPQTVDFPPGPDPQPFRLGFGESGGFVRLVESEEDESGVRGMEVSYVATLEGELDPLTKGPLALYRIELRVESPAAAPAARRESVRFAFPISIPHDADEP